jgi:hypothetical protein
MKLLCHLVLAVFGAIFIMSAHAPEYEPVAISPGIFDEMWMSPPEYWSSLVTGSVLLFLSALGFWRIARASQTW